MASPLPTLEHPDLLFREAPTRLVVLEPDPGFPIVEATDAWLRSRRLPREAVVGHDYFDIFPEGDEAAAAARASLERVRATRAADDQSAPIFAPDGRLRYLVHRDPVEVELLRSAHERNLALRELQATKQELEAFAYSASHDLRSPLRAVSGYCALLRNLDPGMLPPIAQDLVGRMESNIRRMSSIIDGLLQLSRVDTTRMVRRRVDISAMARRIIAELKLNDSARKATVSIAEGLEASADESLVEIALENLLGNAWKYTGRRAVDARIEVGSRRVVGQEVFYVRDNGAGFDMAQAQKLFTPFFRLHSQGDFEGHGIGLATVRRVVERHGGQVWAQSRVGAGTTLHFTLG